MPVYYQSLPLFRLRLLSVMSNSMNRSSDWLFFNLLPRTEYCSAQMKLPIWSLSEALRLTSNDAFPSFAPTEPLVQ